MLKPIFTVSPILIHAGENRISAIGDFVFNLGIGRYRASALRKFVEGLLLLMKYENGFLLVAKSSTDWY